MTTGYRALIVDDEVAMQRLGSHALRQQGFQCESASDGEDALEMVQQAHFDAVITELTLPKKNGYALVLDFLELPNRPAIVVYTDVIEPRIIKDLLFRGVDDVLAKPVHGSFLAGKVRAIVERRNEQEAPMLASAPIASDQ